MEKGIKSRRKILEVAFKLFATYSYPDVSYSLLEEASGISRGSMVYYFNNKEGIFRAVLETFLFNMGNCRNVSEADRKSLPQFYNTYVDQILHDVDSLRQFRIPNLVDARFTIERSALQFVPEFREEERKNLQEDIEVWKQVILNSIAAGEIRAGIDVDGVARLFHTIACGWLYSGIYDDDTTTAKIELLRKLFDDEYALLK